MELGDEVSGDLVAPPGPESASYVADTFHAEALMVFVARLHRVVKDAERHASNASALVNAASNTPTPPTRWLGPGRCVAHDTYP